MTSKSSPLVRPNKGGFLRAFGCGWFIREFLSGKGPYGALWIDPQNGAPQADIFYHYKRTLAQETATEPAVRGEERQSKKEGRLYDPDQVPELIDKHLGRLRYKSSGMRYHSFVTYFHNIKRLGWVEVTGQTEPSAFQDHYRAGQPRIFYRLTRAGREASGTAWANPQKALYIPRKQHSGK